MNSEYKNIEGWQLDPKWTWTSSQGTVYHIKNGKVMPLPEKVLLPCCCDYDTLQDDGCQCLEYNFKWVDPKTREEVVPRRTDVMYEINFGMTLTGKCMLQLDDPMQIDRLEWMIRCDEHEMIDMPKELQNQIICISRYKTVPKDKEGWNAIADFQMCKVVKIEKQGVTCNCE